MILVTGFKPFLGEKINPSQMLINFLDQNLVSLGWEGHVKTLVLPVEFEKSVSDLRQAIDLIRPKAVIMLGQAGGRNKICLEKIALNWIQSEVADESGFTPQRGRIDPRSDLALMTTFPVDELYLFFKTLNRDRSFGDDMKYQSNHSDLVAAASLIADDVLPSSDISRGSGVGHDSDVERCSGLERGSVIEQGSVFCKISDQIEISFSAGTYVCNHLYYSAMKLFPELPSLFVHVPYLPEQRSGVIRRQGADVFAAQIGVSHGLAADASNATDTGGANVDVGRGLTTAAVNVDGLGVGGQMLSVVPAMDFPVMCAGLIQILRYSLKNI